MITRTVIIIVSLSFIASFGLGQVKYGRSKPPSPTPTPTATPQQKQAHAAQSRTGFTRTTPTPSPAKPMPARRTIPASRIMATPSPSQAKATPLPQAALVPTRQKPTVTASPVPPRVVATPMPAPVKPMPTPVPPPDVKAYLDRQLANSKDQKFHMTVNGKDLALTPFHVWSQKSTGPNTTSTAISMRSEEGKIYDIEVVTTGAQITGIRISKINGETLR